MKSIIRKLFFDKEIVKKIKEAKMNEAQLYNLLFTGKITMKEYLNSILSIHSGLNRV